MHAIWLALIYDLLEDIIKTFLNSLLYKTNRFQVAMRLFSKRSQRTSKCGKNISDTLAAPHVPLFCSYHILTSSVIYYWTDARQLGIYLLSWCCILDRSCVSIEVMSLKLCTMLGHLL